MGELRYLVGYLFFNDGIQTVISMASVFMAQELFSCPRPHDEISTSYVSNFPDRPGFVAIFGGFVL